MRSSSCVINFLHITLFSLLTLSAAPASDPPKLTTISFNTEDTSYSMTFDPSKISEQEIRSLIPLSPNVNTDTAIPGTKNFWMTYSSTAAPDGSALIDKTLVAIPVDTCLQSDPAYLDCPNNSISSPKFLRNAKVNLERSRNGLRWLQTLSHPGILQPVVDYLTKTLSVSIAVEDAKFRYYSTWDAAVLKEPPAGLAAPSCPDLFEKLDAAKTKEEKYQVVWHDWHNCVLAANRNKVGSYPVKSWNSFLESFAIKEKFTEDFPD